MPVPDRLSDTILLIIRSVLDQLAEQILAGNLTDGMLVRVNAVNGSLVFEPVAPDKAKAA